VTAALRAAPVRALGLAALAVGIEWARVLGQRHLDVALVAGMAGGAALCLLAVRMPLEELGLGPGRIVPRILGAAALTALLLLPAAVRWTGQMPLQGSVAVMATVVAIGEEVAFRGVLFAAARRAWGPGAAVAVSTVAWTAAHALSHPPGFLLAVAAAGVVLGLWRWYADDLAAPIAAHVLADIAL
jgi:membrane protease YdiL (CAAX protease family)